RDQEVQHVLITRKADGKLEVDPVEEKKQPVLAFLATYISVFRPRTHPPPPAPSPSPGPSLCKHSSHQLPFGTSQPPQPILGGRISGDGCDGRKGGWWLECLNREVELAETAVMDGKVVGGLNTWTERDRGGGHTPHTPFHQVQVDRVALLLHELGGCQQQHRVVTAELHDQRSILRVRIEVALAVRAVCVRAYTQKWFRMTKVS
ncbi:unnamed protein product, partial [Ectocarpus sp. 4 AP-2014]